MFFLTKGKDEKTTFRCGQAYALDVIFYETFHSSIYSSPLRIMFPNE